MFFTRALHTKKTNANVRIVSHICKFFLNFNILGEEEVQGVQGVQGVQKRSVLFSHPRAHAPTHPRFF